MMSEKAKLHVTADDTFTLIGIGFLPEVRSLLCLEVQTGMQRSNLLVSLCLLCALVVKKWFNQTAPDMREEH